LNLIHIRGKKTLLLAVRKGDDLTEFRFLEEKYRRNLIQKRWHGLTEIAGGTPTSGSWKNLFASARARRLLCIPAKAKRSVSLNDTQMQSFALLLMG
jgi:hypothetical protein